VTLARVVAVLAALMVVGSVGAQDATPETSGTLASEPLPGLVATARRDYIADLGRRESFGAYSFIVSEFATVGQARAAMAAGIDLAQSTPESATLADHDGPAVGDESAWFVGRLSLMRDMFDLPGAVLFFRDGRHMHAWVAAERERDPVGEPVAIAERVLAPERSAPDATLLGRLPTPAEMPGGFHVPRDRVFHHIPTATPVAADATPTAAMPLTPDPSECTVEPRAPSESAGAGSGATPTSRDAERASGPPFPDADDPPADAETVAAIAATWREAWACAFAGSWFQLIALYSDSVTLDVDSRCNPTVIAETPYVLGDARVLDDGRVGAFTVSGTLYVVFVRGEDRWLIDAEYSIGCDRATPAA
jgi:hypothetical protein